MALLTTTLQEEYLVRDVDALKMLSGFLSSLEFFSREMQVAKMDSSNRPSPETEFRSGFPCYPNQHLAQGMTGCDVEEGGGALGEWEGPVNDGAQLSLLEKSHNERQIFCVGFCRRRTHLPPTQRHHRSKE